jgi:hypothetical protein
MIRFTGRQRAATFQFDQSCRRQERAGVSFLVLGWRANPVAEGPEPTAYPLVRRQAVPYEVLIHAAKARPGVVSTILLQSPGVTVADSYHANKDSGGERRFVR